jgi:hypothetical protein
VVILDPGVDCHGAKAGQGQSDEAQASGPAWRQVYRSLEHGFARSACERCKALGFPDEIVRFGNAFARLQKERHDADYDPAARFTKPEVALMIAQDKTAFAALVLLKQRKS